MDDSDKDDSIGYNEPYMQLWKRARETNDVRYVRIYNRFIENSEKSDNAQDMAEKRI